MYFGVNPMKKQYPIDKDHDLREFFEDDPYTEEDVLEFDDSDMKYKKYSLEDLIKIASKRGYE